MPKWHRSWRFWMERVSGVSRLFDRTREKQVKQVNIACFGGDETCVVILFCMECGWKLDGVWMI